MTSRSTPRKTKTNSTGSPQWYSRGYLPHFDMQGLTQTMIFRLFDSMPRVLLDEWREELKLLSEKEYEVERRKRIDFYLDQGHGSCYLKNPMVAEIVQNTLLHFDSKRYQLHSWIIMPNHVHLLFTSKEGWELSQIAHSWKSYTASECNKILERKGEFWQREPFDRYIRNEQHYNNAIRYIENNPIKAGLCHNPEDWPWSSAHVRA
ncbi:MAG TPA: transposase [Blastocatellia bacterium]|nr:transposase [Blastocatellia bacterium]